MTTNNPAEAICSICGARGGNFYKVVQAKNGTEMVISTTCSVICMLKWITQYASLQGLRLSYGVKQAFADLKKMIGRG